MMAEGKPVVLDLRGKGKGGGNGDGEGQPGDGDGEGEGADGDGGPGGPGHPGYRYGEGRDDFKIYELPGAHPPRKLPEH
jgi:hypothetical protein